MIMQIHNEHFKLFRLNDTGKIIAFEFYNLYYFQGNIVNS